MHFTRTPLKNKKPLKQGTNKMGQYYSNERVPIKNYNASPIAARIDKNMTNLNVNEQATNKNLNQFIQPVLDPVVSEPETNLNIFNYNYDDVHLEPGLAEKTKKMEEAYEEMKLTFNKNLNTDDNLFNYSYSTEIDMNVNIGLAEKIEEMELTFNKDIDIFNYNYDNTNVNVELVEKIQPPEEMKLTTNKDINSDINVFNYKYNSIDMTMNVEEVEKMNLSLVMIM
jgi:hypothetical protein